MPSSDGGLVSKNAILEHLERENDHLGSRTTWVVTSQAFLFSAYAICITGGGTEATNPHAASVEALIRILPWTAILSLVLFYITLGGGLLVMAKLRRLLGMTDNVLHDERLTRRAGLIAPVLTPGVFLFTWVALLRVR